MRRLPALAPALLVLLLLPPTAAGAAQSTDHGDEAIVVINGDVTVAPRDSADGVFIVNGDARITGRVDGDVVLVAGDATVSGTIDGDLVTIAGQARLLPRAVVTGDLRYGDEAPLVAPAARVGGGIDKEGWTDSLGILTFVGAFAFWLAMGISAAVLGILLLLISPRAADAVYAQVEERFWTAVAMGVAIFIVLPLAAFLAAITLLGLPLGLALGLSLLPLAAIAYVSAAWALGRVILKPPSGRILAFLAGLAILRALALIPVLGLFVWLGAVVVGLGLLGGAITASREPPAGGAPST